MAKMFFKDGTDWINFLAIVYPIDSIYITVSDDSPANLIGGTWSELKGRYYLRCFTSEGNAGYGETGTTGGSNYINTDNLPSHKHTLTTNGAHTHPVSYSRTGSTNGSVWYPKVSGASDIDGESNAYTHSAGSHTHTVGSTGGARYTCPPITSFTCGDVPPRKVWVVM